MELKEMILEAKKFLGEQYFANLNINFIKDEDKDYLKVVREGNEVEIRYGQLASLFRGLTLIKEKNNEQSYSVEFHKHFDSNCFMIDVSRNAVMKLSQVKKIIMLLALFGMNRLMLYTEDTYELKNYPYFGYLRGKYTVKDLKELVEYGESLGVELVPCIETLDHLGRVFRWDAFSNIQDGPSNLNVGEEATYKFIEEMIKTCREAFKTNVIHVGMDESMNIGLGKYLLKHGMVEDRMKLFTDHLRRVTEICKKYDFKPIIWSDMFFRLIDTEGGYYTEKDLTPEIIKIIPEDVDLVYWDYYHDARKVYETMLKKHLKLKNKILFAGGAWNWSCFAPFTKIALERSETSLEVMIENNIKDVLVTTLGDFGAECSNFVVLPCLACFSIFDFEGKKDRVALESVFEAVTGEKLSDFELLDLPNEPEKEGHVSEYNCSRYYFYQDPLLGLFDHSVKDGFASKYASYLPQLEKVIKKESNYQYLYQMTYDLIKVLKDKVNVGVRLRKAYKAGDLEELKLIKETVLPRILDSVNDFERSFAYRWKKENKVFGLDVVDGRIGFLKNRLLTAIRTLDDYLNKRIDKIEELEEDILPFSTKMKEDELFQGPWPLIVSPCEV